MTPFVVGEGRFELPTACSQSRCIGADQGIGFWYAVIGVGTFLLVNAPSGVWHSNSRSTVSRFGLARFRHDIRPGTVRPHGRPVRLLRQLIIHRTQQLDQRRELGVDLSLLPIDLLRLRPRPELLAQRAPLGQSQLAVCLLAICRPQLEHDGRHQVTRRPLRRRHATEPPGCAFHHVVGILVLLIHERSAQEGRQAARRTIPSCHQRLEPCRHIDVHVPELLAGPSLHVSQTELAGGDRLVSAGHERSRSAVGTGNESPFRMDTPRSWAPRSARLR